jgi:ferritin-like metal-binding protein YciE
MKRFLFLLVVAFFPMHASFAQLVVADAAMAAFLQFSQTKQWEKFGEMAQNGARNIEELEKMVTNTGNQINMAVQNLRSVKDIHSWDDFRDWYDRQLYYGKTAVEVVKGMNVSIGKKNYSMWDLEKIADGLNETYVEYWNKEFTEEQRREMWLSLGLSPANYAYVQPYLEKGKEVARQMLAMSDIQNRKNKKTSEKNKNDMDALVADADKPLEEQMGQKEVAQRTLAAIIRSVETLEDIAAMQAKDMEFKGIDKALDKPLQQTQKVSSWKNGFEALKK